MFGNWEYGIRISTRRLVKLALAIAAGTEGDTHSAVRHAMEMGITMQELEHVVLLSITTLGFPAAGRAMAWVYDSTNLAATKD